MYRFDLGGPFRVGFDVMPSVLALNVGNFVRRESDQGGTRDQCAGSTLSSSAFASSKRTAISWVGLMFHRPAQSGAQSLWLRPVEVTNSVIDVLTLSVERSIPEGSNRLARKTRPSWAVQAVWAFDQAA